MSTLTCVKDGKMPKEHALPSLHQERVSPDFGFPVWFEPESNKIRNSLYKIDVEFN